MLYARPSTNTNELRRLAVEYEQRYHEQRGPAFDTYVRKHNLQRYLKPYQGATLMGLSPDGRPIIYAIENLDAARSVRTNMLWPGGASGYDLSGFGTDDLAMWDAGSVRATHREFNNLGFPRLVNIDHTATHYHATHIAGTLVAGGLDADARGMSYEARIDAYDWYNDLSEIAAAAADGIRVSNHSYGIYAGWEFQDDGWHWYGNPAIDSREDWKFGFYDVEAHDFDELAHNAPYLTIVTAAGNDRSLCHSHLLLA